jgi:hypothetical protein
MSKEDEQGGGGRRRKSRRRKRRRRMMTRKRRTRERSGRNICQSISRLLKIETPSIIKKSKQNKI